MTDNLLIDLPEIRLPRDMAWRVKFVDAVEQHAKRLGLSGNFQAPRFFGYYFIAGHPVVIAGHWTVMLEESPLLKRLHTMIDRVTDQRFRIGTERAGAEPDFMLVHDRHDGSCWLWDYLHGRRFLEAGGPPEPWGLEAAEDLLDDLESGDPDRAQS